MKNWSPTRVLLIGATYLFGACAGMTWLNVARLRADEAAYKPAHGLAENADYMARIVIPSWQLLLVFGPPAALLLSWWLLRRTRGSNALT